MSNNQHDNSVHYKCTPGQVTIDDQQARLSYGEELERNVTAIPRGNPDGQQQVEQLLLALYDGFTHDTRSCAVINEILEALVKMPDIRTLDALVMIEAQMIDRDSPLCPARLPGDVITYYDPDDDSLHRAVPRDIHLNLFAALERISVRLHDREELVTARLEQYRRLIIEAEIERIMPALVNLLQDYEENVVISPGADQRASQGMPASDDPVMNTAAGCEMPETDYVAVLMKMETELREYLMGRNTWNKKPTGHIDVLPPAKDTI